MSGSVRQMKSLKRPWEDEALIADAPLEPSAKQTRTRTSTAPARRPSQEEASTISRVKRKRIDHWRKTGFWPTEDQDKRMHHVPESNSPRVLPRKEPTALVHRKIPELGPLAEVTSTASGQKPRDEKNAPYKHPRYETQPKERGSFTGRYPEGVTAKSTELFQKPLRAAQLPPKYTLFSDDLSEKAFRERVVAEVLHDLKQLFASPAEVPALRGNTSKGNAPNNTSDKGTVTKKLAKKVHEPRPETAVAAKKIKIPRENMTNKKAEEPIKLPVGGISKSNEANITKTKTVKPKK